MADSVRPPLAGGCASTPNAFHDWTGERRVATIGTNAGSDNLPFQDWRRFKEAFAPELIQRAVSESNIPVRHIVDPFGGSGTTALAAQFLGIQPTTIEVNPFLADLVEAKIASYDLVNVTRMFARVMESASGKRVRRKNLFPGAPLTFLEPGISDRFIFSKEVAERFCAFRDAVDRISNRNTRRLFRVLLASTAVSVSNVLISGKGRRYRTNWQNRPVSADLVDETFQRNVLAALFDLRRYEYRPTREYRLLRGDARKLIEKVTQFELAVFSPPYPNSFDYTDVYNVELWALGYLSSVSENRKLREATLRSHVQIKRNFSAGESDSTALLKTCQKLQSIRGSLWNRNIPEMIAAYFNDMRIIISALHQKIEAKGRVYIVVGDSRYGGITVPVGQIIADDARALGFMVRAIEPFRSMRASPQQGGKQDLAESLVVLQRR
jgi:hypothetical protein